MAEIMDVKRAVILQENGSNYTAWKFQISIILKSSGLYSIWLKSLQK